MPDANWHYRESERFIGIVLNGELLHTPDMRMRLAVIAQTHATLALAAAHGADAPAPTASPATRIHRSYEDGEPE